MKKMKYAQKFERLKIPFVIKSTWSSFPIAAMQMYIYQVDSYSYNFHVNALHLAEILW